MSTSGGLLIKLFPYRSWQSAAAPDECPCQEPSVRISASKRRQIILDEDDLVFFKAALLAVARPQEHIVFFQILLGEHNKIPSWWLKIPGVCLLKIYRLAIISMKMTFRC